MKLFLEELPHQEEALKAIMDAFPKIDDCSTDPDINYVYANPLLYGRYDEKKFLDVKMETGTGKTYVYYCRTESRYQRGNQTFYPVGLC